MSSNGTVVSVGKPRDFESLGNVFLSLGDMAMTTLETAAGFLSQVFSDYPFVGAGLIAVLLAILFLLPR